MREGEGRDMKVRKQTLRAVHSQDAQLQWVLFVPKAGDWYQTPATTGTKPAPTGRAIASQHSRWVHISTVIREMASFPTPLWPLLSPPPSGHPGKPLKRDWEGHSLKKNQKDLEDKTLLTLWVTRGTKIWLEEEQSHLHDLEKQPASCMALDYLLYPTDSGTAFVHFWRILDVHDKVL